MLQASGDDHSLKVVRGCGGACCGADAAGIALIEDSLDDRECQRSVDLLLCILGAVSRAPHLVFHHASDVLQQHSSVHTPCGIVKLHTCMQRNAARNSLSPLWVADGRAEA